MQLSEFEQLYRETCSYDRVMGLQLSMEQPGQVRYRLTITEQHLSSAGACHGGVLAGMMDATLGLTAVSWAVPQGKLCATVEFKINYLRPALLGHELEGVGVIDHAGSRLIVSSATISDIHTGQAIAKGLGTFNLYPLQKKPHLFERLGG